MPAESQITNLRDIQQRLTGFTVIGIVSHSSFIAGDTVAASSIPKKY